MENILGIAITVLMSSFSVFVFCAILFRYLRNHFSAEREVTAMIIEKQKYRRRKFYHSQAPREEEVCIVTFQWEKQKLSFSVSPFSYADYPVNQTGRLKYKGSKLISFEY